MAFLFILEEPGIRLPQMLNLLSIVFHNMLIPILILAVMHLQEICAGLAYPLNHVNLNLLQLGQLKMNAMQDTILALNTGYWKTRDGTVLARSLGKACVVNPQWREKLDNIATIIEEIRKRFAESAGLNRMLLRGRSGFDPHDAVLRSDRNLGEWMDAKRQEAIDTMNTILRDLQMQPLSNLRT
jgi:hypothetical protein